MTVKQLVSLLIKLDKDAIIDMSVDGEGNAYGDISTEFAEGKLKDGRKVYSMYPENSELSEDRYQ